ncbi:Cu(I)-responsive transcriptional regulator [Kineobactrum salinum]|uniref:Cu(I)-responsive transcriptional regulator n=1 Tax=Kineobactrum salinum TaxID=2708301 RepID=A0A6C0U915_9GAMM|nr:Cu(I)-responsive transcriptional regulator [Kineobactrum salinum]
MTIGQIARASGVSARMIRHYEDTGLIPAAIRSDKGYRYYGEQDLHRLRFVRQARKLGFSIEQIAALLGLWQDQQRSSKQVKSLAAEHIAKLDQRIAELQEIRATLAQLIQDCRGDQRPECPILENLAWGETPPH